MEGESDEMEGESDEMEGESDETERERAMRWRIRREVKDEA